MTQHSGDDRSDQSMATSVAMDTSVYEMPESAPIEQSIHISGSDVSVDPLKPFVVRKVVDHSMATSAASLESSRDSQQTKAMVSEEVSDRSRDAIVVDISGQAFVPMTSSAVKESQQIADRESDEHFLSQ